MFRKETQKTPVKEIEKALNYPVVEVLTKPFNERDIKRKWICHKCW